MRARRGSLPLFVLLLFSFGNSVARAQPLKPLLEPTRRPGAIEPQRVPTVLRQRNVVVDLRRLQSSDNSRLRLPLFEGGEVVLVRDRPVEAPRKDTLIWYGHVDGQPGSTAILSNVREALAAAVWTRNRAGKIAVYEIGYLGNGVHALRQIDQSKFPPEETSREPKLSPPVPPNADTDLCGDTASFIDALVVYTGTARYWNGGQSGIESKIFEAVGATNQSYLNSGIGQQIRLVHMEKVTYQESGIALVDLGRLQDTSDGVLDDVLTLRNTYAADVVVLIVNEIEACGWSSTMPTISTAFESSAYAVVDVECATVELTFAHELGHIMGARHDRMDDPTQGQPFDFNHGRVVKSPTDGGDPWRTVMAKDVDCLKEPPVNCSTRIPYWSNPNVRYASNPLGDPTGTPAEDNHLALNETAQTVANFRCASPAVNDVWMRDTGNDTGAEPDPKTAADVMWASSAIWVRTSPDTANAHLHDHENPVAGSANFVYVELENGGEAVNGNLELYWANPSTSLSWPSGWTSLATVPVAFAVGSPSKVVEVPWTPPQSGHFCLLARWASVADPMKHPETGDIESNVRGNNNIVWRNLNVIDLAADPSADATFGVGDPDGLGSPFSIMIRPTRGQEEAGIFDRVRVTVALDEKLMSAWRRGGMRSRGLRTERGRLTVSERSGAVLENLQLAPRTAGRVKLTFEKSLAPPAARTFGIDVVQLQLELAGRGRQRTVGGVSYVIRTGRVGPPPVE
jgi:hypothetical protein